MKADWLYQQLCWPLNPVNKSPYHPSACLSCYTLNMDHPVICEKCNTAKYCKEKCRKWHFYKHREVCGLLKRNLIDYQRVFHTMFEQTKYFDFIGQIKRILFSSVTENGLLTPELEEKLTRKYLVNPEFGIFFNTTYCPKCCINGDPTTFETTACSKCLTIFYCGCRHHRVDSIYCSQYALINKCLFLTQNSFRIPKVKDSFCALNFFNFSLTGLLKGRIDDEIANDEGKFTILSMEVTEHLSLLYAITKLPIDYLKFCFCKEFVIHIVGAHTSLPLGDDGHLKWEQYFLQFIPQLSNLRIVFCEPVIESAGLAFSHTTFRNSKYSFDSIELDYKEYITSKHYVKPDIIVKFGIPNLLELELNEFCIGKQDKVPIVVTESSYVDINKRIMHIQKENNDFKEVQMPPTNQIPRTNQFASLYPIIPPMAGGAAHKYSGYCNSSEISIKYAHKYLAILV